MALTPAERAAYNAEMRRAAAQMSYGYGGPAQLGYRNLPGQGKTMFSLYGPGGFYQRFGGAADPTWQYRIQNGQLMRMAYPNQAGRIAEGAGSWQAASPEQQASYQRLQAWNAEHPGQGFSDYLAQRRVNFNLKTGNYKIDPTTGYAYNMAGEAWDPRSGMKVDADSGKTAYSLFGDQAQLSKKGWEKIGLPGGPGTGTPAPTDTGNTAGGMSSGAPAGFLPGEHPLPGGIGTSAPRPDIPQVPVGGGGGFENYNFGAPAEQDPLKRGGFAGYGGLGSVPSLGSENGLYSGGGPMGGSSPTDQLNRRMKPRF